jgi:polyisoprenoid-binding protein YceI
MTDVTVQCPSPIDACAADRWGRGEGGRARVDKNGHGVHADDTASFEYDKSRHGPNRPVAARPRCTWLQSSQSTARAGKGTESARARRSRDRAYRLDARRRRHRAGPSDGTPSSGGHSFVLTLLRRFLLLLALALGSTTAADAALLYHIESRTVTVGFHVENMWGTFATTGNFQQVSGDLLLDLDNPRDSRVDVNATAASLETGWATANRMLLSPGYLDPSRYPSIRFISQSVEPLSPDHVIIHGQLTLRGITREQDLDARLEGLHDEPGQGPVADFVVIGEFERGRFGMTADHPLVAEQVSLQIHARIRLTPTGPTVP